MKLPGDFFLNIHARAPREKYEDPINVGLLMNYPEATKAIGFKKL